MDKGKNKQTANKLIKCPVISYNPYSGVIVYSKKGKIYQTNAIINYDGKGYVLV